MSSEYSQLHELYYNPDVGLLSADRFWEKVKKKVRLRRSEVLRWVAAQEVSQLHRREVKRKQFFVPVWGHSGTYQADLMFISGLTRENSGYHVIFTLIEVTTRVAYAYALKGKTAGEVDAALAQFLRDAMGLVVEVETDAGTEFVNFAFDYTLEQHGVLHVVLEPGGYRSKSKIERWNKTLRDSIFRYLTVMKTKRWVDALDALVYNYNHTVHRALGKAPADMDVYDAMKVRALEQWLGEVAISRYDVAVGDRVRVLLKKKHTFQKGAEQTYSSEVYTVTARKGMRVKVALNGAVQKGSYTLSRLLKV